MNSAKKLTFPFEILKEILLLRIAFFLLSFLISLITSTLSTVLKEKELFYAYFIAVMLGYLLYFIINFNVGQDTLSDFGLMLLDSGTWSGDATFEK